jgi:hypothetical protein
VRGPTGGPGLPVGRPAAAPQKREAGPTPATAVGSLTDGDGAASRARRKRPEAHARVAAVCGAACWCWWVVGGLATEIRNCSGGTHARTNFPPVVFFLEHTNANRPRTNSKRVERIWAGFVQLLDPQNTKPFLFENGVGGDLPEAGGRTCRAHKGGRGGHVNVPGCRPLVPPRALIHDPPRACGFMAAWRLLVAARSVRSVASAIADDAGLRLAPLSSALPVSHHGTTAGRRGSLASDAAGRARGRRTCGARGDRGGRARAIRLVRQPWNGRQEKEGGCSAGASGRRGGRCVEKRALARYTTSSKQ